MRLQQWVVPQLHEDDQFDDDGRCHDQRDPSPREIRDHRNDVASADEIASLCLVSRQSRQAILDAHSARRRRNAVSILYRRDFNLVTGPRMSTYGTIASRTATTSDCSGYTQRNTITW